MIQTIVLIQNGKYPFGQIFTPKKLVKVEDIRTYNHIDQLKKQKIKVQNLYLWNDQNSQTTVSESENFNIIKLIKIYQSELNLHFVYQYIPFSLDQFIQNKLYGQYDIQKSQIIQMNSKLFLKKVCYQLGTIISFLIKRHIKVDLQYELLGIDEQQNLKIFIDPGFVILSPQNRTKDQAKQSMSYRQIENQLKTFYEMKKQQILNKLQKQFVKIKKKEKYVPNFVIKGNQLIFCNSKSQIGSECYSPCPSSFSQSGFSGFTQRCQSVDSNFVKNQFSDIRKTHGNLFNKLKKTQSYNYHNESNKKLQQNIRKLEQLKQRSKKLNEGLKQSYLSNKNMVTTKKQPVMQNQFKYPSFGTQSHVFNKKGLIPKEQQSWRNSQIPSNLRKTHLPNGASGSNAKSPNRFGNFDNKRSKSNRNHKSSFQFKPKQMQNDWFNPNKSFDKSIDEQFQDKSFQQTKSIRIQLEQSRKNKQRKNSYKVKILTCQQMQLDGQNVQEFVFNAMNKNFGNQQQEEESQLDDQYSNESNRSRDSQTSKNSKYSKNSKFSHNRFENMFTDKYFGSQKNEQYNSKFSQSPVKQHVKQKERQTSNNKSIFQKYYEQFNDDKEKTNKNQKLQQKIKLAKQKAQNVLNKYMKSKKYSNKTSASKLPF